MMRLVVATVLMLIQAALLGRGLWAFCKGGDGLFWFVASTLCGLIVTVVLHA